MSIFTEWRDKPLLKESDVSFFNYFNDNPPIILNDVSVDDMMCCLINSYYPEYNKLCPGVLAERLVQSNPRVQLPVRRVQAIIMSNGTKAYMTKDGLVGSGIKTKKQHKLQKRVNFKKTKKMYT